jgi:transposase
MKRSIIKLTKEERAELTAITKSGRHAARKVQRARILLKSDSGLIDQEIAEHLNVSVSTIERVRRRCALEGVHSALTPRPRPPRKSKLDGELEAKLVHLACCEPPEGRLRWTMNLLADKLVELKWVDDISRETVRRGLKKKRAEALANSKVLHPSKAKRSVRSSDGGRA